MVDFLNMPPNNDAFCWWGVIRRKLSSKTNKKEINRHLQHNEDRKPNLYCDQFKNSLIWNEWEKQRFYCEKAFRYWSEKCKSCNYPTHFYRVIKERMPSHFIVQVSDSTSLYETSYYKIRAITIVNVTVWLILLTWSARFRINRD